MLTMIARSTGGDVFLIWLLFLGVAGVLGIYFLIRLPFVAEAHKVEQAEKEAAKLKTAGREEDSPVQV